MATTQKLHQVFNFALAGSLLALGACSRSDPAGESGAAVPQTRDISTSAAALGSKSDALRELGVIGALANQVAGGGAAWNSGNADAQRVRPWAFNGGERAQSSGTDASQGACPGGGSFTSEDSSASRSYALFGGESADTAQSKSSEINCKSAWPQKAGVAQSLSLNGLLESGASPSLSYGLAGNGSEPYTELYEKKDGSGKLVDSIKLAYRGLSEVKAPQGGTLDARAIYAYRYARSGGDFFSADVGSAGAPFKVEQGDLLRVSGPYGYASKSCGGGNSSVNTVDGLAFDGSGEQIVAGTLEVVSGAKKAVFRFKPDGGADLDLNGATQAISASELRAAINPANPC
ncbi:hypothetical protein [Solimonas sp. K1W22B-7]|uniref:hypothetical protein n=1 Tax=Solimonas sp. K1W22B-7 TaxID=2303331 RepID=UPI0013C44C09|nr:hypothetical protein [Solimonas sp. K1W22B-7]